MAAEYGCREGCDWMAEDIVSLPCAPDFRDALSTLVGVHVFAQCEQSSGHSSQTARLTEGGFCCPDRGNKAFIAASCVLKYLGVFKDFQLLGLQLTVWK